MTSMDAMSMHGGSATHAAWAATGVAFLGMWIVMTAVMMLPSAIPMLERYRRAVRGAAGVRLAWLTALAGAGYWLVWIAIGAVVFPLDVALSALLAAVPALGRAAPLGAALVVVVAGAYQLTAWKARRLACCREVRGAATPALDAGARIAWRHGVGLGVRCARSCANLMAIPLVLGVMDLRAMAAAGLVIAAERLAPAGYRVAHGVGVVAVAAGLVLIVRALGPG
jgi:predicted metal-binding membrane protein